MTRLEKVRAEFVSAVYENMKDRDSWITDLSEIGKPKLLGMLFGRWKHSRSPEKSLNKFLPEFEIQYRPGWDFNLIIRRKSPAPDPKETR